MAKALTTNGLIPAPDFPSTPYEAIHAGVLARGSDSGLFEDFVAAWNAVAYRFHSAVEAGEVFQASFRRAGPTPNPAERFRQDNALANFFGSGYSAIESATYGLHAICALIDPLNFSLSTPKAKQQVSPIRTAASLGKTFPGDQLTLALDALLSDPAYEEWREIRNVLTHRTAPGRTMYVGIGVDDAPPTEWKLKGISIDDQLVSGRRAALSRMLGDLLNAIAVFVGSRV